MTIVQISRRGQVTLPAEVRRALALRPGDTLIVRVEEGKVVLEPAAVLPIELYSDERLREEVGEAELRAFRAAWGLDRRG